MNFRNWIVACLMVALVGSVGMAHEGHDQPGALPSAPHGGKVKEATGGTKTGPEAELFFEAVFQEPSLKLYPLTIDDSGAFKALSPKQDLSKVSVEIEFPRAGKKTKPEVTTGSDLLETTVSTKGATRFMVILSAIHKGESKKAKIQVEKK